ncbi:PDGLE domain-containing protein [Cohnella sp. AR92]|uniref:PDGLE domain-containing protein n=1 Tax=Cohnella sp. AR92 TaxID=648716 RepID=UPI000F8EB75F|nr:PDGLE domain-containing protein [Cohnella sp. AR92]RUS47251.1 hypothetical protein ELR57_08970 [Cohnella sp. AR92]
MSQLEQGTATEGRRVGRRLTAKKGRWLLFGLAALLAGGLLSLFASGKPDGLNRVAEDHGFAAKETGRGWTAWLSGYEMPGIASPLLKAAVAGAGGAVLLFLLLYGAMKLIARGEEPSNGRTDDPDAS